MPVDTRDEDNPIIRSMQERLRPLAKNVKKAEMTAQLKVITRRNELLEAQVKSLQDNINRNQSMETLVRCRRQESLVNQGAHLQ